VRDPVSQWQSKGKGKGKGADAEGTEVVVDPGVTDKRLYILEPEFAGALTVMKREGNILSRIIRDGWDRGNLATLTKNSPARATGAHITILGHITADELRRELDRTSMCNGYANRFLFACVRRARILPFGGTLDEKTICELGRRLRATIDVAQSLERVTMTRDARDGWRNVYPALSEGEPGLLGAIVGRAEAQVIRLALIYALLNSCAEIDLPHLKAGLAVSEFCENSARYIFGDALGDPIADEILRALRQTGDAGMTRTQIRDLFGRNRSSERTELALSTLVRHSKAQMVSRDTGGRPAEVWISTSAGG
jgi:DNA-binding transcriptional ArsR family regulator